MFSHIIGIGKQPMFSHIIGIGKLSINISKYDISDNKTF